jgi:hypothetical protein
VIFQGFEEMCVATTKKDLKVELKDNEWFVLSLDITGLCDCCEKCTCLKTRPNIKDVV